MDGWMDGLTDGSMNGWMDGWMDGYKIQDTRYNKLYLESTFKFTTE